MTDDDRILELISCLLTLRLAVLLHPGQGNRAVKAACQQMRTRILDR